MTAASVHFVPPTLSTVMSRSIVASSQGGQLLVVLNKLDGRLSENSRGSHELTEISQVEVLRS